MNTFLLVLRLAFWGNPLQRVLTCIGLAIMAAEGARVLPFGWPVFVSPIPFLGFHFVSAASLLMGGVFWRIASAPRIVRLAPHGRMRLLGSVMVLVLLITVLLMVQSWLYFLRWTSSPPYPSGATSLAYLADSAALISLPVVGMFVVSRSPRVALAVLIVWAAPGIAVRFLDADLMQSARLPNRYLLALIWIPFGIWYLTVRRISFPRWLASGGQDVLAATVVSVRRLKSPQQALQCQLLGGTTAMRLALQWFAVVGILLGAQWMVSMMGELNDPELVARTMYASLCICPIVTVVISFAAIRRSRSLWLLTTSNRGEFFICIERILMRVNVAMALVFAGWLAVLWGAQSWYPGPAENQLILAIFHFEALWVLGLFAIYSQFAGMPKWPVAILAASALIFVWRLSAGVGKPGGTTEAVAVMAAVVLLVTTATATIALRWQAQRRWREGDFPRPVTSTASGT